MAENCCVDPTLIEAELGETTIRLNAGGVGLTVTGAVAFFVESAALVAVT